MRVPLYALTGATVFLGAFLLFSIQPLIGKQLLPLFGGSAAVWTTSLVFFTSALFFGYLYVYLLAKLQRAVQVYVHVLFIALASLLAFLPRSLGTSADLGELSPALQVLFALAASIGLPFLLLATTGPLLQYWYGTKREAEREKRKEPYSLYSLSNAASFIALLSYPFLIEPYVRLASQRHIWLGLFVVYALLLAANARVYFEQGAQRLESSSGDISWQSAIVWVVLAALPAFMLVAVTTKLTQQIAPVPLLWVVPLALYLLTFVIAFRGRGQSVFMPLLFLVSVWWAWSLTPASWDQMVSQIAAYCAVLFFCGLCCHVLLYKTRPDVNSIPAYYLFLSFGGALGTIAASILAPLFFTNLGEFPLALALSAALAIWILPLTFFPRIVRADRVSLVKLLSIALIIVPLAYSALSERSANAIASRNFYGSTEVIFDENITSLWHGTTLHGTQLTDPADELLPTKYYTPGSGVGRAILHAQNAAEGGPIAVGIIGLGTGTIAAYCRNDDTYVFYEVDQWIEVIARAHFSYLSRCEGAQVRVGDGRLVLENELRTGPTETYDVLAIDAFSDDSIPVHLLTKEAFEIYDERLEEGGILAVHISNRYLDLAPVVFRIAAELGMNAMRVSDDGSSGIDGSASNWLVLTRDERIFTSTAFSNTMSPSPNPSREVWTDDYSSLVPVLDFQLPWE